MTYINELIKIKLITEVFVDPDKLEEFINSLRVFQRRIVEIQTSLDKAIKKLGATWQDQEYFSFQQAFLNLNNWNSKLINEIDEVIPKLKQDVQYIREYNKIKP